MHWPRKRRRSRRRSYTWLVDFVARIYMTECCRGRAVPAGCRGPRGSCDTRILRLGLCGSQSFTRDIAPSTGRSRSRIPLARRYADAPAAAPGNRFSGWRIDSWQSLIRPHSVKLGSLSRLYAFKPCLRLQVFAWARRGLGLDREPWRARWLPIRHGACGFERRIIDHNVPSFAAS